MRSHFIAALVSVLLLASTGKAAAHPLGNFSISQYSAIRIHRDEIRLRYIVDLAEIPTFQEIQANGIKAVTDDSSLATYLDRRVETLRAGLRLEVNGRRLVLSAESREIILPPGASGLPTMKIGVLYEAKLPLESNAGQFLLSYRDNNFTGRAGWKEIIAIAEPGTRILHSSAPEIDRSSQLNDYPTDLLNSPPQELEATVAFNRAIPTAPLRSAGGLQARWENERATRAGTFRMAPTVTSAALAPELPGITENNPVRLRVNLQGTPRNRFTELMATKQLAPGVIFVALAVAIGLGAFHALEPGHGKTLVAAYLVGSRGTVNHAFLLGLIVTAAHTAGVYLLGAVTLYASHYVVPEQLYPWLAVISGVMVAGLGMVLLIRRYLLKDAFSKHHHQHHHHGNRAHDSGHFHGHHHSHDDGHTQTHGQHDSKQKVSLRELLTLGISGGIIPCPAALVVLLSAVSMQRIGFGLLLIVAFSLGLAVVLITIGLFMVCARQFMSGFQPSHRLTTRWLPMMSSVFILLFGIALTIQALLTVGILPAHL